MVPKNVQIFFIYIHFLSFYSPQNVKNGRKIQKTTKSNRRGVAREKNRKKICTFQDMPMIKVYAKF